MMIGLFETFYTLIAYNHRNTIHLNKIIMNRYKKNLKIVGNKVISYTTHVANIDHDNRQIIKLGYWSVTTAIHINYVGSEYGYKVVDQSDTTTPEQPTPEPDIFNTMKAFLALGELTNDTREEKQSYNERIVFATMRSLNPYWEKPENWDSLPLEERESRITKMKKII